jgi:eukaryotic translation initiation factor 2-alpha kinase 4
MIPTHLYFHRFPRTYPTNAHPIFTVKQPVRGIPDDCITKLSNFIQAEARQSRGTVIVFQVSKLLNRLIMNGARHSGTISPLYPQSRPFDPTIILCFYPDYHNIQVITLAQDWIATNISPPVEVVGSLASEMIRRASEEEQVSV